MPYLHSSETGSRMILPAFWNSSMTRPTSTSQSDLDFFTGNLPRLPPPGTIPPLTIPPWIRLRLREAYFDLGYPQVYLDL